MLALFRKRRDRYSIIAAMLTIAKDSGVKNRFTYKGNLNFAQLREYLPFLLQTALLTVATENQTKTYTTTHKGIKYLEYYDKLSDLLRIPKRNSRSE